MTSCSWGSQVLPATQRRCELVDNQSMCALSCSITKQCKVLALYLCRVQRFRFKHKLYKLREERDIKPSSFAQLVSATLYEKRFGPYFCQPVIAGLEPDGKPYLCGMDSIGAIETAKDFMIAGTASDALLGICESLWRPDMVRYGLRIPMCVFQE